ncbi:uncharacterized protein (N-terminal fragment), partial [Sporisorium reilianum f. sp. reilianum]
MSTASWLILLLPVLAALCTSALPLDVPRTDALAPRASSACTSIAQRVNWNTLSPAQKNAYFDAVKCLKT